MKQPFDGKRILITGGTGSLGQTLVRRILRKDMGDPARVIVFSRDEAKQHFMRVEYQTLRMATDDVIYQNYKQKLQFRIGDVRDFHSVASALREADIVVNAAALKQVPTCEYFPYEAVRTNVGGAENIVRSIEELRLPVEIVVGVSTDKACKPVNTMGMTKAIQERVFIQGNMRCPNTKMFCVRYGNVLASRGSVIPLFHEQIRNGGPVTITTTDMTRFLLSLDDAVDTIFAGVRTAHPGETYVPRAPSALVQDIATVLIGDRKIDVKVIGIRPGEKVHEIMVSEEEAVRTVRRDRWLAIRPMLPELAREEEVEAGLKKEYSSSDDVMDVEQTRGLLRERQLLVEQAASPASGELLR